jgi:hypothetical protein
LLALVVAVNTAEPPTQIAGELTLTVGSGFTVTTATEEVAVPYVLL